MLSTFVCLSVILSHLVSSTCSMTFSFVFFSYVCAVDILFVYLKNICSTMCLHLSFCVIVAGVLLVRLAINNRLRLQSLNGRALDRRRRDVNIE